MSNTGFIVFSTNKDLSLLFAPRVSAARANVGYVSASTGLDISNSFEKYASGTKALTTGFKLADRVTDLSDVFQPYSEYAFTGATQTGTATAVTLTYTTSAPVNSAAQLDGTFSIFVSSKISNLKILMVSGGGGGGTCSGNENSAGGGGGGNVVLNTVTTATNVVANVFVGCGGAGAVDNTSFAQTSTDSSLVITGGSLSGALSAPNNGFCGSRSITASTTQVSAVDYRVGAGAGGGGGAFTGFAALNSVCLGGTSTTGGRGGNATSSDTNTFTNQYSGGGGGGGSGGAQGRDVTNASRIGTGGNGTTVTGFGTYGGGGGAGGKGVLLQTTAITAAGGTGGGGTGGGDGIGGDGTANTGGGGGGGALGGGDGANGIVIITFTFTP